MTNEFDLARLLVAAPRNTPLRVRHIFYERVRERCAARGVLEGSDLRCLGATKQHLLLELPDRGRVELALGLSICVEVEPGSSKAWEGAA